MNVKIKSKMAPTVVELTFVVLSTDDGTRRTIEDLHMAFASDEPVRPFGNDVQYRVVSWTHDLGMNRQSDRFILHRIR